jgi:hypothetical protein
MPICSRSLLLVCSLMAGGIASAAACEQGEIRCMAGSRMVCQCDAHNNCSWGPASGSCYRDDSRPVQISSSIHWGRPLVWRCFTVK